MTAMAESARQASPVDPTHYPVDEEMPEGVLQRVMMEELRPLVQRYLDERGEVAFAGADQFIYWVQHEPTTRVAPDVYVLPGVPRDSVFGAWKVWETGIRPSVAIEIVGINALKDYEGAPERYAALGVDELVIVDPEEKRSRRRQRWRFQVWRRQSGRFVRVEATDDRAVSSRVLGCWLTLVGDGPDRRVRLAAGAGGEDLFPTEAEAEARRAEAEKARADAEKARADAAEAELARLRSEIERAGRG